VTRKDKGLPQRLYYTTTTCSTAGGDRSWTDWRGKEIGGRTWETEFSTSQRC